MRKDFFRSLFYILVFVFYLSPMPLHAEGLASISNVKNRLIQLLPYDRFVFKKPLYDKYLAENANLRSQIGWDAMSSSTKTQVYGWLKTLENGGPYPIPSYNYTWVDTTGYPQFGGKPALLTPEIADEIFSKKVAVSLFVEVNHLVPWSLKDRSEQDLRSLFDKRVLFACNLREEFQRPFQMLQLKVVQIANKNVLLPILQYEFCGVRDDDPIATYFWAKRNILGSTEEDTVSALLDWVRKNFVHYHVGQNGQVTGYDEIPNVAEMIEKKITGCYNTAAFIAAVLRSVNVPSYDYTYPDPASHAMVYFPSVGRVLMHADNPYDNPTENGKAPALLLAAPIQYFEDHILSLPNPGDWGDGTDPKTLFFIEKYLFNIYGTYPTDATLNASCTPGYISAAALYVDPDQLDSFLASLAQARAQANIVCPQGPPPPPL